MTGYQCQLAPPRHLPPDLSQDAVLDFFDVRPAEADRPEADERIGDGMKTQLQAETARHVNSLCFCDSST